MSKPLHIEYSKDFLKHLLNEKYKEIERLNNIIKNIEEERCKLHNANELLENAIDTLRKRNEEIYEGFMATTEELCEATKEIERLNNIIKEVREYIEKVETLAMVDKVNIFSMSTLKTILDKEKDNE